MPFFGAAFFEAIEGYADHVAIGYLRALWHYWNHTHCAGLPDDDEYLRRICRCDPVEWEKTKAVIFDGRFFFCKNGSSWHQKHARDLHGKELDVYNMRVALAANARNQKGNINPDTKSNNSIAIRISQEKELDRIEKRLAEVRQQGTQTAGGPMTYSIPQRAEIKTLKDKREELKKLLGFVA